MLNVVLSPLGFGSVVGTLGSRFQVTEVLKYPTMSSEMPTDRQPFLVRLPPPCTQTKHNVRKNSIGGREVPTYIVSRHPSNWGFLLESCWTLYTSWEMPPRDGPGSDRSLLDDKLKVTMDDQWEEVSLTNLELQDIVLTWCERCCPSPVIYRSFIHLSIEIAGYTDERVVMSSRIPHRTDDAGPGDMPQPSQAAMDLKPLAHPSTSSPPTSSLWGLSLVYSTPRIASGRQPGYHFSVAFHAKNTMSVLDYPWCREPYRTGVVEPKLFCNGGLCRSPDDFGVSHYFLPFLVIPTQAMSFNTGLSFEIYDLGLGNEGGEEEGDDGDNSVDGADAENNGVPNASGGGEGDTIGVGVGAGAEWREPQIVPAQEGYLEHDTVEGNDDDDGERSQSEDDLSDVDGQHVECVEC